MPRYRRRQLAQVPRGVAQTFRRQGKRIAHRLAGDRYRGMAGGPALVSDGGAESKGNGRERGQGPRPHHFGFRASSAANHSAPMKRDIR